MNIRFEYRYRDAGNYKNGGDIVFAKRGKLSADALTGEIRKGLISKEFFVAEDVGIPALHFDKYIPALDHGWHEFIALTETTDEPTDPDKRDVSDLIAALKSVKPPW